MHAQDQTRASSYYAANSYIYCKGKRTGPMLLHTMSRTILFHTKDMLVFIEIYLVLAMSAKQPRNESCTTQLAEQADPAGPASLPRAFGPG